MPENVMSHRIRLGGALALTLAATALPAQGLSVERLDSLVARNFRAAAQADSPGCAVTIIQDGRPVLSRAFGSANLEHGVPVTVDTRFHLASVSKQFTALAVLLLAADGKLSLDDDIRTHVPEVPDFGEQITIGHLLHHTSGIRDYWDLIALSGRRTDDVTEHDVLEFVTRQRALNFRPGEEHLYNNTGYILLGIVVKRASGMTLPRFAQERIFAPLGMASTRFLDDHAAVVPGRATGYARGRDGAPRIAMPAYDVAGSAGVVSTVGDLAKWDENFHTAAVGGPGVVSRMREAGRLRGGASTGYGGGLNLGLYRGLRTEEHNGVDPGYVAELLRFPDQRLTIAALCNGRTVHPIDAAYALADSILAGPIEAAGRGSPASDPPAPTVAVASASLRRLEGPYVGVSTNLVRRIVLRGDSLFYARPGGDESHLRPIAPERFVLSTQTARIEVAFVPRRSGRPEMHVMVEGAPPSRYVPVDSARGLPARLAEYAGSYHSPELGATYRIGTLDGELHWRIDGLGPDEFSVTLPPRFADSFGGSSMSLGFVRDSRGRVAALELTTQRARRIRFDRVPR